MSNYSKTTDFEAKDSLPTGDSGKIIRGSEFETEFDAISTAIATKADTAGPTFTGTLTFETISDGTINVTAFVDEDNMASNSATLIPTQQSVKAYVDSQLTAQDLDFQADSGGALSIDLDSETMTFTGGTGIDTSGSGNAVTFAIDSTVATLTGSQTLTNKTLTSPVLNTGVSGTAVLDEDDMASNSATQLATQQSIKAYVNSQVAANNELSEILANGNTTGGANIVFGDSASVSDDRLVFGAGSDQQIYHSGTHSYIDDAGTGNLTLRGNASVRVEKYEGEILADFAADGAVSLYHDNSVKIATTSSGVSVTGNVAVSGTVDGRDVATDGSKLDGIEASADVTDATNVTAAGALMDSELTSEASVKALNQGVATTDSPTFAAVTVNGNVEFDGLSGTGSVNVTDILDQDDMSSNSATALATQQSIKAYVDSQVATADTLAEVLANGNTTGGTNIVFGDSSGTSDDRLVFGAGSDLQIYHDASHSYIVDAGTGNMYLSTNGNGIVMQASLSETMFSALPNGSVRLYYDNSQKLETTSTGIDVTGVAVVDGLTSSAAITSTSNSNSLGGTTFTSAISGTTASMSGSITVSGNSNTIGGTTFSSNIDVTGTVTADGLTVEGTGFAGMNIQAGASSLAAIDFGDSADTNIGGINYNNANDTLNLRAGNLNRLTVASNGDVSLYEDTGTTAKMFWDASAESLGIGTSSPTFTTGSGLEIQRAGAATLRLEDTGSSGKPFEIYSDDGEGYVVNGIGSGMPMIFKTVNAERMRIDASGNLLVGKTSADTATVGAAVFNYGMGAFTRASSHALDLNRTSSNGDIINLRRDNTSVGSISVTDAGYIAIGAGAIYLGFYTDGSNNKQIIPMSTGVGGAAAGTIDLGMNNANHKFKDLYLSGTAYVDTGISAGAFIGRSNSSAPTADAAMYRAADNTLAFSTASTERMRIDSSGAVLIHPNNATRGLKITSTTTGTAGDTTTYDTIAAGFGRHVFKTDGTERVRIDQSGKIKAQTAGGYYLTESSTDAFSITSNGANGKLAITDEFNSAERLTILQSGNVGINNSSPAATLHTVANSGTTALLTVGASGNNIASFYTSGSSQVMTLDSSGNLLVGTTSTTPAFSSTGSGIALKTGESAMSADNTIALILNRNTANGDCLQFRRGGTTVGSVSVSGTNATFNTSSDQRLKDNIVDAPSASDDIDAIQVRSFDWKVDGSHQKYGMVAQELQSVAPEAVSGDADSDDMMGVDYSKLVPMLVKEIQSLRARVAQLEGAN